MKKLIWLLKKFVLIVILILCYTLVGCQQPGSESKTKAWNGKWLFVEFTDSAGVKFPGKGFIIIMRMVHLQAK
jgi:hypothetical protein